jgi:hypothetical protein
MPTADKAKRANSEIQAVGLSADYFEGLLRARLVRVMKQLQKDTSINQLAMAMHNLRDAAGVIDRQALEKAVAFLKPLIKQAYMRGGKLGATHVKSTLRNS